MRSLRQGPVKRALISYRTDAVMVFSPVTAIKANWAQAVTRSWVVASFTVGEMHFSGNQMATISLEAAG
jgi:hypothetical protein